MTSYKIKGRPLLCFSINKNPELKVFNKGPEGRSGDRTMLAEQKGRTLLLKSLCMKS